MSQHSSQLGESSQVNEGNKNEKKTFLFTTKEEVISAVCRLLLAATGTYSVVRRDEIVQFTGRNFKFREVLDEANRLLQDTFGFEIAELVLEAKSGKLTKQGTSGPQSNNGRSKMAAATKAYVLVNTLDIGEDFVSDEEDENFAFLAALTAISVIILVSPDYRLSEESLQKAVEDLGLNQQPFCQETSGKATFYQELVKMWYLRKEQWDDVTMYCLGPRIFKELSPENMLVSIERLLQLKLDDDYKTILLKRWNFQSGCEIKLENE
eukprot:jgi/Galph1/3262/GphlegSOOS_G1930.1